MKRKNKANSDEAEENKKVTFEELDNLAEEINEFIRQNKKQ